MYDLITDVPASSFGVALLPGGRSLVGAGGLFRLSAAERAKNGTLRGSELYGASIPLFVPTNEPYRGVEFFVASDRAAATTEATTGWDRLGDARVPGDHGGCVERRATFGGLCEFDGRVSLALFKGRLLLYARANTNPRGGGRWVQVGAGKGCDIGQLHRLLSRSFSTPFG